jgi:signal transduction histidine kinase
VAASLAILLALTVLLGWLIESTPLTRVHPALPAMMPITAVCLILASGSLACLLAGPRWALLTGIAATGVAATGVVTLASYVWGFPLPGPGLLAARMSPQTALTYVLLGVSLLCTSQKHPRARALAPWLALIALLPPLVALTGYAFLESRLYGSSSGVGMALNTAVGLTLLSIGTLMIDPRHGPLGAVTTSAAGGVMARRMLPTTLLPLAVGALTIRATLAGVLDPRLAGPLFSVTMMVLLATTIWRNAITLNHLHAEQVKAEQQARAEAERQRTLAAENAQLYRTAQQAMREREDVLATVSHDLKNPLSAIRLSTAILASRLKKMPDSAALGRQVSAIERSVAHMITLIHQLLDAARLDAGQALVIEPRPEPMDTLVGEALALIEPQASQKSLRLEQRLTAHVLVPCDRGRITQVLTNLLSNAVKFTPDGGTLAVECTQADGEVRVSVRDTGPGIPESEQAHLFERHWQAQGTARQGSGLGLYIARGIIDAHGGRIWVESTPGMGSTFTFSLPLPSEGITHEA